MAIFFPSSPISGGLFLSYKCNATCKHCIYASSPKWPSDWMTTEALEQILKLLAGRIQPSPSGAEGVSFNHGLHFTGGEPFLKFDLLLEGITIAKKLRIPSLFAETNAFWCQHDDDTGHKMQQLKEAGMRGLLISVNPFTLESVPFDRTVRAIQIGSEVFGQNLMVYQTDYFMQFRRLGLSGRIPLQQYINQVGLREATSRIELLPIGRAVYTLNHWFHHYPASAFLTGNCAAELQRAYHNHWDNYGNLLPGFCAGLALGNLNEQPGLYEEGLDLDEYPILDMLLAEGVGGLYQYARNNYGYQESEDGYISQCHLCVDIRTHIVSHTQAFKELQPVEFYTRLRNHTSATFHNAPSSVK